MIRQILGEYNGNLDNTLYRSAMNMIVKANKDKFKEGDVLMCEALEELFMELCLTGFRSLWMRPRRKR